MGGPAPQNNVPQADGTPRARMNLSQTFQVSRAVYHAEDEYLSGVKLVEKRMLGKSPHRSSSHIAEYRRLKCAGAPVVGRLTTRSMAEVTALSQRPARAVPDCVEYHSGCSMMSATAASLRTRRFFFTAYGRARGERESSLAAYFGYRKFNFRPLGGSDEFLFKIA